MTEASGFVLRGVDPAKVAEKYDAGEYATLSLPLLALPVETADTLSAVPSMPVNPRVRTLKTKSTTVSVGTVGHPMTLCLWCRRPCIHIAGVAVSYSGGQGPRGPCTVETVGTVDTWECMRAMADSMSNAAVPTRGIDFAESSRIADVLHSRISARPLRPAPHWMRLERNGGWESDEDYGKMLTPITPLPNLHFVQKILQFPSYA